MMFPSNRRFVVALTALLGQLAMVAAWGTDTEQITYITPIYEGLRATNVRDNDIAILQGMKDMLSIGGSYTKLGLSFSSWVLSRDIKNSSADYVFDPTNLQYELGLAKELNLPILIHVNAGRWAICCTIPNYTLLDYIAENSNTTMQDSSGNSLYQHLSGHDYFSLSRLDGVYRAYKQRNIQAAMGVLMDWAVLNPDLFVGVSLDSETLFPSIDADYGPLSNEEWRQWLQNTGIYGPGGAYFGQGRIPAFTSIDSFNQATGTSFLSWDAITPPMTFTQGDPFSEEWHRWRITSIDHAVSDETNWIAAAGVPRDLIYGHQTPNLKPYDYADVWSTHVAANGAGGVTMYARDPLEFGNIDNPMRALSKNNFGVFEVNPLTNNSTLAYDTMVTYYNDGIKVVCPNAFENATHDRYSLFDSPSYGDTFGDAIKQFLSDYGELPRNLAPPPWNPGNIVYDLYDEFDSATSEGPDNHLNPNGSSGNVVRKTVYSAVGGTITYKTTLPSAPSGQRLNFWTSIGIKDGAGTSGGNSTFKITINGHPLLGSSGMTLPKMFWTWKQWVPAMIDVTEWADNNVTIVLTTTGNSVYGWSQWGAPAIYLSTSGNNNLALGKPVSVSSSEGSGSGWSPSALTDGNIEGTSANMGWSSVSHSSSSTQEWAQIDLGSEKPVGKVVLFSRSDLSNAAGTGFPTEFLIQGSTNASSWTTLVSVTQYPTAPAGQGQIFHFEAQAARYIRVLATELGGVASEPGYRMQLAEIEVYSG